jgi:hypothetical protein
MINFNFKVTITLTLDSVATFNALGVNLTDGDKPRLIRFVVSAMKDFCATGFMGLRISSFLSKSCFNIERLVFSLFSLKRATRLSQLTVEMLRNNGELP